MAYIIIPGRRQLTNTNSLLKLKGSHPLVPSLSFCAVPHGNYLLDLVSGCRTWNSDSYATTLPIGLNEANKGLAKCIYYPTLGRFGKNSTTLFNDTLYERHLDTTFYKKSIISIKANSYKGIYAVGGWSGYHKPWVGIDSGYAFVGSMGWSLNTYDLQYWLSSSYSLGNPYLGRLHSLGLSYDANNFTFNYSNNATWGGDILGRYSVPFNALDKTSSNVVAADSGYYAMHLAWVDKTLSNEEMRSIINYPYQLFESNTNRTYFDVPAAVTEDPVETIGVMAPYLILPSRRLQQPSNQKILNSKYLKNIINFGFTNKKDISGNDWVENLGHVPIVGTPYGKGFKFNGTSFLTKLSVTPNYHERSLFAWVNPQNDGLIMAINESPYVSWILMAFETDSYTFKFRDGGGTEHFISGSETGKMNKWSSVCITSYQRVGGGESPTTIALYVDGKLISSGSWNYGQGGGYDRISIGGHVYQYNPLPTGGYSVTATVANPIIFNKILSSDEILQLHSNPSELFESTKNRIYFDKPEIVVPPPVVTRKPLTLNAEGGIITPTLLGSGTPASDTFLRGDGTWQTL